MMPKIIQGSESSGSDVWWSTRKSGAICVYIDAQKPSKLLSKWKWCLAVNKTATKAASKYVFMKEKSVKTALKQDKFTGSEGDLTKKLECTSEGRLDPEECNNLWCARSCMQKM